jgi:hypothetical protein
VVEADHTRNKGEMMSEEKSLVPVEKDFFLSPAASIDDMRNR